MTAAAMHQRGYCTSEGSRPPRQPIFQRFSLPASCFANTVRCVRSSKASSLWHANALLMQPSDPEARGTGHGTRSPACMNVGSQGSMLRPAASGSGSSTVISPHQPTGNARCRFPVGRSPERNDADRKALLILVPNLEHGTGPLRPNTVRRRLRSIQSPAGISSHGLVRAVGWRQRGHARDIDAEIRDLVAA